MHRTRCNLAVAGPKGRWNGVEGNVRWDVCEGGVGGVLRVGTRPMLSCEIEELLYVGGCWIDDLDIHNFLVEEEWVIGRFVEKVC